jgi:hypothetical protein
MKSDVPLSLPLKGGRSYVHSTDMYPAALEAVADRWAPGELQRVQLVCRMLTGRELALTWNTPPPQERVAAFSFEVEGEKHKLFFVRREGEIQRQIPYDEDAIASRGEVDTEARSVGYRGDPAAEATLVEVVVALTKALHQALFPGAGKWVVTQIESDAPLYELQYSELKIALVHNMGGARLTKSEIVIDGVLAGHIFFSST